MCVESPLKLVGTWDLLLTQRALITSLGTLLLPRGNITSCLQYSVLDVSRLEFKSPGLTLRLLRVSKGPLRFKLGTLPIVHPYRPPETLPLLPLFCKLLWKLREKEVRDAQACLASSPQLVLSVFMAGWGPSHQVTTGLGLRVLQLRPGDFTMHRGNTDLGGFPQAQGQSVGWNQKLLLAQGPLGYGMLCCRFLFSAQFAAS